VTKALSGADPDAAVAGDLLARLVCPVSRTPLRLDAARGLLIADAAGLAYPIRGGVPILLPDAAIPIGDVVEEGA